MQYHQINFFLSKQPLFYWLFHCFCLLFNVGIITYLCIDTFGTPSFRLLWGVSHLVAAPKGRAKRSFQRYLMLQLSNSLMRLKTLVVTLPDLIHQVLQFLLKCLLRLRLRARGRRCRHHVCVCIGETGRLCGYVSVLRVPIHSHKWAFDRHERWNDVWWI